MKRRDFLSGIAVAAVASVFSRRGVALDADSITPIESVRTNWRALLSPAEQVSLSTKPLAVAKADWRKKLAPKAYQVLFEEATERPFSSPLNDEKRGGVFVCAACRLPLFSSDMKFDSGTGWPSFFTHIPDHLATSLDFRLIVPRTEYHCVRCGGHQGHIFKDGPQPTGERWCNNGLALEFLPFAGAG